MTVFLVANNASNAQERADWIHSQKGQPGEGDTVVRFNLMLGMPLFGGRCDAVAVRWNAVGFHGVTGGRVAEECRPAHLYMVLKENRFGAEVAVQTRGLLAAEYGCEVTMIPVIIDHGKLTRSTGYTMWRYFRRQDPGGRIVCVGFTARSNSAHAMDEERAEMRADPHTEFW